MNPGLPLSLLVLLAVLEPATGELGIIETAELGEFGDPAASENSEQFPSMAILVSRRRQAVPPPPRARKMHRPQLLTDQGQQQQLVRTDYFEPRDYTSRDLPRFLDGFGQQIGRDMDKAHSELTKHADTVRALQYRMQELEQIVTGGSYAKLSTVVSALLCPILIILLCANCVVLRRIVVYGNARP